MNSRVGIALPWQHSSACPTGMESGPPCPSCDEAPHCEQVPLPEVDPIEREGAETEPASLEWLLPAEEAVESSDISDTSSASVLVEPTRPGFCFPIKADIPALDDPLEAHWEYVSVPRYQRPALPALPESSDWRRFLPARWRGIRLGRRTAPVAPVETNPMQPLPRETLRTLLPPLPTNHALHAMERLLYPWLMQREPAVCEVQASDPSLPAAKVLSPGDGVRFLIGPPHSSQERLLRRWARSRKARIIEPPSQQDLLSGNAGRWKGTPPPRAEGDTAPVVWVIPALERWFLRHSEGLHWVRALLQSLQSGDWGTCIVGCDSWAWTYLHHAQLIDNSHAYTLQAFDGPRLGLWLERATNRWTHHKVLNRSLRHATPPEVMTQQLRLLAGETGGNVFVAYYLWREGMVANLTEASNSHGPLDIHYQPLANPIGGPDVLVDNNTLLLWHALLLHNGLPQALLEALVPISPRRLHKLLHALAQAGIAAPEVVLSDRSAPYWRITPRAYPAVQSLLASNGYLHSAH